MGEVVTPVRVERVRLLCDTEGCEGVEMKADGLVRLSHPPQYSHRCPNCNGVVHTSERYPALRYVDVQVN